MEDKIAIIGLGYVGLPLALSFGEKYRVIGFDVSELRIDELKKGIDKTLECDTRDLINSKASLRTSGSVEMVFTTSTRGITGAGLKKCRPMNCSFLDVEPAI